MIPAIALVAAGLVVVASLPYWLPRVVVGLRVRLFARINGAEGTAVTSGGPSLVAPERLRQPVHVPAAGEVTIAYHVTSADDAEAAGVLRFTARAGTAVAPGTGPPAEAPVKDAPAGHEHGVDPVSAALLVLDGLVALGVVVLLAVRPRPSRRAR